MVTTDEERFRIPTTGGLLLADCSAKLERLITAEIGADVDTWVLERPNLGAWPSWQGDRVA
jgi:hypothetical protein